ncbi:MAG: AAA family ATPase, partial [Longimicrobiales bacterium]
MRFEGIQISRYGQLTEVRTPKDPLPSIVIVLGPNEGGKSTFFSFLTTLMYGFTPATREAHPYAPWSGDDAEGRAQLKLDDGTSIEIHRRLLSNGWGRLTVADRTEDIRNQPLSAAGHVPRPVFNQVYALTLSELAGLEGESWDLIQDRLVGAMGSSDLIAARTVAANFEKQSGALWRPTRRGNQAARSMAAELADLKNERRAAVELDRTLRSKAHELHAAEQRLRRLREEREQSKVLEYRVTRLLPVQRKLDRIEELEAEAGDLTELDELPGEPQARLDELRDRYRSTEGRIKRLDDEMAEPRQVIQAYTPQHRAVAEHEEKARALSDRIAALRDLRETVDALAQEVRDFDRRCQVQSQDLFNIFWSDVDPGLLDLIPSGELRDRIRRYHGIRERRRVAAESARQAQAALHPPPPQSRLIAGATAVAIGVLFLIVATVTEWASLPLAVAVAGITLGLVLIAQWWEGGNKAKRRHVLKADHDKQNERRIWEIKADEEGARERVLELVSGLPIHD